MNISGSSSIFSTNYIPSVYGGGGFTNEKSILFDGVDEYVSASNITALNSTTNFTISLWQELFGQFGTNSNVIRVLSWIDNKLYVAVNNSLISTGNARGSTVFTTGQWYNIVISYDGGGVTNADKLKCYVDGSAETLTFTGTIPTSTYTTSGGTGIGYRTYYTDGYIDEVAVFDYTLNGTQITSIYNSGTPTDLDNTSGVTAPVHWWRMGDGDTYPTITDVGTTGGNNGTMTNMESGDIVSDTP
jgi:hypothetical protein